MTNLLKHPRTGVYWYRKAVPEPLRRVIGKREVQKTLKTKDPAAAKTLAVKVAQEVDDMLARARRGEWPPVGDEEIRQIARSWYNHHTRDGEGPISDEDTLRR